MTTGQKYAVYAAATADVFVKNPQTCQTGSVKGERLVKLGFVIWECLQGGGIPRCA